MSEQDRAPIRKTGPKDIAWFNGLRDPGAAAILVVGGLIKLVL